MKYRVEVNNVTSELEYKPNGDAVAYTFNGKTGVASVRSVTDAHCSVLLGSRVFDVLVLRNSEGFEAVIEGRSISVSLADARDRAARSGHAGLDGPAEVRAQMPGKIVKLLVAPGESVASGQAILVIEAMKMQNELKAPKSGTVEKLLVTEGSTVTAGEILAVVA